MSSRVDVVICVPRFEEYFELLEFVVDNIGKKAPIDEALGFDEADYVAVYGPKIRRSLESGFSYIAVEKSTDKIVGCALGSVWHRNPRGRQRRPSAIPSTPLGKLHYQIECSLRSRFWDLCPKGVNKVAYGECLLIGEDHHKERHFGERLMKILTDESFLEYAGVDGSCGMTTSLATQRNAEKFGAISLVEVDYGKFFKSNGILLDEALVDGTRKAILHFTPFDCDKDFSPEVEKLNFAISKL